MEYALLFSLMGTTIVWQWFANRKLKRALHLTVEMMDHMVSGRVQIERNDSGFKVIVNNKGE